MTSLAKCAAVIGITVLLVLGAGCGGARSSTSKQPIELTTNQKIRKARSLMTAGRLSEALATMDEAVSKEPGSADLRSFRGQLLFMAGRYPEAEVDFKKALELDPYRSDAHNYLGAVYDELGRDADAEREYKTALADPSYATPELVYLNLGLLYVSQGRDDEALQAFRESVGINPKYYKAHFELASTLERLGKLEEAAREFEVAGPGFGGVGDYYYRLGMTYFRLGDKVKARQNLERVLDVSPGSPTAAQADELLRVLD